MRSAPLPGVFNLSVDEVVREAEEAASLGLGGLLLFGLPETKDEQGTGAWDDNGIVQQGLIALKQSAAAKKLVLIADVCLCEYTSHGHCGLIVEGRNGWDVDNDPSLELLGRTAASLARAGADVIASQRHDGRPRRRHPPCSRRQRQRRGPHPQLRLQVRVLPSTDPPGSRRLGPSVRRPQDLSDGWSEHPAKQCAKSISTSPKAPT